MIKINSWDNLLNKLLDEKKVIETNFEHFKYKDRNIGLYYFVFDYQNYYFYVTYNVSRHYISLESNENHEIYWDHHYEDLLDMFIFKPFKKINKTTNEITIISKQKHIEVSDKTIERIKNMEDELFYNVYTPDIYKEINKFCEVGDEQDE